MPTSISLTEASHMDRLTQTQDAIDELVKIMYSTLSYLTRKASFKQVNPDIPITQTIPNSEPPEIFAANQVELVNDFLKKAKQLEYLISVLPASPAQDDVEFAELENELKEVNEEYLSVLTEAESLHSQLSANLRMSLDARSGLAG